MLTSVSEIVPSNILIVLYIFLQISKCNAVIASLKNEVSMLDKVTHDQQRKTLADATKQCNVDAKISEGKKVKMRDEMILIKRELRDHRREHRSAETSMRKVNDLYLLTYVHRQPNPHTAQPATGSPTHMKPNLPQAAQPT